MALKICVLISSLKDAWSCARGTSTMCEPLLAPAFIDIQPCQEAKSSFALLFKSLPLLKLLPSATFYHWGSAKLL